MSVRVIVPPQPIVTPADIVGDHAADDASIVAMIAAVTGEIDGPNGWLGRSLGVQTLELSLDCWSNFPIFLPYPPAIEIVSVVYLDRSEVARAIDDTYYGQTGEQFWFRSSWSPPSVACVPDPIRIRYSAGYDGQPVAEGGTGDVPAQARQAIILSVQHMKSLAKDDLFVRADEVDGIGRREFTISEVAGTIIDRTCSRLLSGLRLYV